MNVFWEVFKAILMVFGGLLGAFVGFLFSYFVFSMGGFLANPGVAETGGGGVIVAIAMLAAAIVGPVAGGAASLWFLFRFEQLSLRAVPASLGASPSAIETELCIPR